MAAEDWLGITEEAIAIADKNDDELTANLNRVLEKNYKKLGKDMLKLYDRLEDADPKFIQVELSKLKQNKIALQILNPKELDRYEREFEKLMEKQSALGVSYGDLMIDALSNPPELVEQFGQINIDAAKIALESKSRLKNQTNKAAKDVKGFVAENLLRGGSNFQLAKQIQGRLGTSKAQAATIARTESTNVLNESSRQRYQQYGAEFLQIIALIDEKTTPWCRYRHMKVIKITDEVPAYHMNCRSTTAPVDPDWISADDLKWMQEERAAAQETGLSISGKAPFDVKKPVFRSAETFVKQQAKKPKPKPEPKEDDKTIKRSETFFNLSERAQERTSQGLISDYDPSQSPPEINKRDEDRLKRRYAVKKREGGLEDLIKDLGDETQDTLAVFEYVYDDYKSINRQARGSRTSELKKSKAGLNASIRRLDRALEKLPSYQMETNRLTGEPMPLYRGLPAARIPPLEELSEGYVFEDEGFKSFTKVKSVAENFGTAMLVLETKGKGSKFKDLTAYGMAGEQEVLGQRDALLVLDRVEEDQETGMDLYFVRETTKKELAKEKQRKAEEERRKKEEAAERKRAEEKRRKEAERKAEQERKRKEEEEKKRKAEEKKRKAEEAKKQQLEKVKVAKEKQKQAKKQQEEKVKTAQKKTLPKLTQPVQVEKRSLVDSKDFINQEELEQKEEKHYKSLSNKEKRDFENKMQQIINDADIKIRVPSTRVLEEIINSGRFKSQFETQTSQGVLSEKARSNTEKDLFNYPENADRSQRPIYGYLGNKDDDKNFQVADYGDIAITFKKSVKDRATMTTADSLNSENRTQFFPSKIDDFKIGSLYSDFRIETERKVAKAELDPRDAITPEKRIKNVIKNSRDVGDVLKEMDRVYLEAQIHGGLPIEDIESIVFSQGTNPSKKIEEWAKTNNVKIEVKEFTIPEGQEDLLIFIEDD